MLCRTAWQRCCWAVGEVAQWWRFVSGHKDWKKNEGNAKTVVPVNGRPPTTPVFVEVAGSLMVIPCNDASMVLVLVVWHGHFCFHHPSSAIIKPAISVKAGHAGTEAHAKCLVLTPVQLWVVEIHQALVSLGKKSTSHQHALQYMDSWIHGKMIHKFDSHLGDCCWFKVFNCYRIENAVYLYRHDLFWCLVRPWVRVLRFAQHQPNGAKSFIEKKGSRSVIVYLKCQML